jgi:hypothetical protein
MPSIGFADFSRQFGDVLIALGEQFAPTNFGAHRLLQELGSGEAPLLDQLVEVVRKIDLHTRHTPNYTPSTFSGKHPPLRKIPDGPPLRLQAASLEITFGLG